MYTRLGGTEDNNVFVLGITSDGNSLFYQNAPDRKVVNVNSNTINKLTISGGRDMPILQGGIALVTVQARLIIRLESTI